MKIGHKYKSSDGQVFLVIEVRIIENQKWVFYMNVETKKNYSCHQEAFLNRFTLIV